MGAVHCSARDVRGGLVGRRSFGFVRNPWAWLVSAYHVGWFGGVNGIKEVWPGGRVEPFDAPGVEWGQRENMRFAEWVGLRKTTPMDWLCDGSEVLVDEVRRFEDVDFGRVWEQRGDHLGYLELYTPELAEYVRRKCWREVEVGGYVF